MKNLNEKGFVFIDAKNRPFWCCLYHNKPWLMFWNEGQKAWVTLRAVTQQDIFTMLPMRISEEQAEIYHDQHNKHSMY